MNWNYCPNCGHRIYQHNDGDGCIHETQIHHIIRVHEAAGFTIKHPLAEREQDKLMDCPVHQQILGSAPPSWIKPGDYALVYGHDYAGAQLRDETVERDKQLEELDQARRVNKELREQVGAEIRRLAVDNRRLKEHLGEPQLVQVRDPDF
jgi:hypothetical protein